MASKQSRWTTWRQQQKLDKAVQLGLQLFQPDIDLKINNVQNVHAAEVISSDSSDISADEQDLLADNVADVDLEINNIQNVHIAEVISSDFSDVSADKQDLLADHADDFSQNPTHFHIRDSINSTDIASALVLLKKQHRLSTKCIDDIIRLLKSLHVPNTPSSWYEIKRLLIQSKPQSTEYFICPTCDHLTTKKGYCQFCSTTHHIKLQSFRSVSITTQ